MFYIYVLTLIIIGSLAAANLLQNKIPQSKGVLDFINPHSSWIGLVTLVLGLYWFLKTIFHLGRGLQWAPVFTIVALASSLLLIILGAMYSKGLIHQFFKDVEKVKELSDRVDSKFSPMREKLGLGAIGIGLFDLLMRITM